MSRFMAFIALLVGFLSAYAQEDCFVYDRENPTIITDLTIKGAYATELSVPEAVTLVKAGAFAGGKVTSLNIDGGNPEFKEGLFGEYACSITSVNMGNNMTEANMKSLLSNLDVEILNDVTIEGYPGTVAEFQAIDWSKTVLDELLSGASVTLAAELVANQTFGAAEVYGRFTLDK